MIKVHQASARLRRLATGVMTAVAVTMAGCGSTDFHPLEAGFANQSLTQVQFYSPPGATVTVDGGPMRSHQISSPGVYGHRLEYSPEEFSVFNLEPGRLYEFKYTTADGLPGVSIYGELEVRSPCGHEAKVFQRRSFVPIALPSAYYEQVAHTGDEIFPYRNEAHSTAIDALDLQRLKQGDVIEKVLVVADLEQAERVLSKTERAIARQEAEMEYADARYNLARREFRIEVADSLANITRSDREFIKWEEKRVELRQEMKELLDLQRRTKALLKGDHVLARKGMLVLATENVVESHRDVIKAAKDLGEVLLIMRIGGRHMQWGDPRREMAAYED